MEFVFIIVPYGVCGGVGVLPADGLEVLSGTYCDGQQFGVCEVSRDMVGLGPERLPVPVACFLRPVQPHVGLP